MREVPHLAANNVLVFVVLVEECARIKDARERLQESCQVFL